MLSCTKTNILCDMTVIIVSVGFKMAISQQDCSIIIEVGEIKCNNVRTDFQTTVA